MGNEEATRVSVLMQVAERISKLIFCQISSRVLDKSWDKFVQLSTRNPVFNNWHFLQIVVGFATIYNLHHMAPYFSKISEAGLSIGQSG